MRFIRLDTQILLYFLVMVLIAIAFLTLNHRSQRDSLEGFNELLQLYGRADIVHQLNAEMASLELQISQYYSYSNEDALSALETLHFDISQSLSSLANAPLSESEAELIGTVQQQLSQLIEIFHVQIVPQLEQISSMQQQIKPAYGSLVSELDRIGSAGPGRENLLELGLIFQALNTMRSQTELFMVRPNFGLSDEIYLLHMEIGERVEEFSPYYESLPEWKLGVDEVYAQTNQLIQITRNHLYNANVLLASRVNMMTQSIDEIESQYSTQAEAALTSNRERLAFQEFQFLILAVLTGILAIFLSGTVSKQLARPIQALVDVFHRLASGQRVTKIPMIHRKDDFGKLARAAEIFRHKNEDTQYLLHQSQSLVKELQELNSELNEQISVRERVETNLAHRQEELERSNRDLSQFAYAASHDLQEPLRMVSSYLQLLERRYQNQLDDDARDFIGFAVDGAARMKNLIRSLLDYSRIGTHGSDFGEVSLNMVVKSVKKNLELLMEENQVKLTSGDLPIVWGDEAQLQTLVQNIVTNSIHYRSDEAPRVDISCSTHADHYELCIKDNGIGFEQQFSDKIFTIFQRLHGRNVYAEGTGIGLALSKRIVERHGGTIWAVSEPGVGTTIHFSLPTRGL